MAFLYILSFIVSPSPLASPVPLPDCYWIETHSPTPNFAFMSHDFCLFFSTLFKIPSSLLMVPFLSSLPLPPPIHKYKSSDLGTAHERKHEVFVFLKHS